MKMFFSLLKESAKDFILKFKGYRASRRFNKNLGRIYSELQNAGFGVREEITEEICYANAATRRICETVLPVIETDFILKVSQINAYPVIFRTNYTGGLRKWKTSY